MLRASEKQRMLGRSLNSLLGGYGTSQYLRAILLDAPLVVWACDDSSGHLADSSGFGRPSSIITGTPVYRQPGPWGGAYSVEIPNGGNFQVATPLPSNDNWTMEFWLRVAAGTVTNQSGIMRPWADLVAPVNQYDLLINTNRKIQGLVQGIAFQAESTGTFVADTWRYCAVVRAAGTFKYYFDGALDNGSAGTNVPQPNPPTSTAIMAWNSAAAVARYAYFALYSTALDATKVAAHYAARG